MTEEQPAESTTETEPRTTWYVILEQHGNQWTEVDRRISAASGPAAVSAYLKTLPPEEQAGTYEPVPVRSWKPITVEVETQTKLKFS